jgi:hypothetical protein
MRSFQYKFFILCVLFIGPLAVLAGNPPSPTSTSPTGKSAAPPPPPPLPIDENLMTLFVLAMIMGCYVIYSYKQKTKAAI